MRNNFDDLVRERCKDLLLAGHLARVIAAQQFMGHTDQQFGEFLAPLIQTEPLTETPQEVTSEEPQQETSVPNIRTGTVHLKPATMLSAMTQVPNSSQEILGNIVH